MTLTGGLPYHGGPGSNYVTHAVCNAVDHVRSGSGPAVVHGNGYYLTKHAVGVYSADAPRSGLPEHGSEPEPEPTAPTLRIDQEATGPASIVAWTVPYGRDGSFEPGILIADTPGGARTVGRADDELTSVLAGSGRDLIGETVVIRQDEAGGSRTITAL